VIAIIAATGTATVAAMTPTIHSGMADHFLTGTAVKF
jgi:hypothetical protein